MNKCARYTEPQHHLFRTRGPAVQAPEGASSRFDLSPTGVDRISNAHQSGPAPGVRQVLRTMVPSSANQVSQPCAGVCLLATLASAWGPRAGWFHVVCVDAYSLQQGGVRECAMAGVASSSSAAIPACNSPSAVAGSSANWNSARSSRLIMPCRTRASKLMISFQ